MGTRGQLILHRVILGSWVAAVAVNTGFGVARLLVGWWLVALLHFLMVAFICGCYGLFLRPRMRALKGSLRKEQLQERAQRIAGLEKEMGL
jgi:hypothetical protein